MPAKDTIHDAVKRALIKDGWTITADPFNITYGDVTLAADLAAERPLAAEKNGQKIAVEVKSFLSPSPIHEFQAALGQYQTYRAFLEVVERDRQVFLAIGQTIYERVFLRPSVQLLIHRYEVALVVVDVENEEIVKWTR